MKRIVSGITPSGDGTLHIGNYLGAVDQFITVAKGNESFLFVADLHALTTIQDRNKLQKNVEELVCQELALLGDLKVNNITFFRQSDVPLHTELQSVLNNITPLGLLKRAHAYKDKLQKDVMEDEINLGLFSYPILMAADILIYKPDLVPVGKDQKQHVEITRDVAQSFNKTFKTNLFKLPEALISDTVATILGTDGQRKMSKSIGNIISIFEDEAVIRKQVNSCFTDPTRIHANDPGHIEGNMVFAYLDLFADQVGSYRELHTQEAVDALKKDYQAGKIGDQDTKEYLANALLTKFTPARRRYLELKQNPDKVKAILSEGAAKANAVASQTMAEVRKMIGLSNTYSFFAYPKPKSTDGIITIDDFDAVHLRVGKVTTAANVEKSERLIRLTVDFGPDGTRTIFTAVRGYGYTPEDFAGKQFFFVYNLQPRKMMGEESQGMILAVDGPAGEDGNGSKPIFVSGEGMPIGAQIR
jgi:tryptophanyl-tRNA synthetase